MLSLSDAAVGLASLLGGRKVSMQLNPFDGGVGSGAPDE